MNKKALFFASVAALALAACNKSEVSAPDVTAEAQKGDVALNFGAYLGRGVATKSGLGGILDNDGSSGLEGANLPEQGFGVFAYYNDGEPYSETSKPDFMYNTKVSSDDSGTTWTYSPLRYWPNEFGNNAISEDVDRLSFFAYAPYVPVNPKTGVVVEGAGIVYDKDGGIVGMTRNSDSGDPFVKYIVSFDTYKSVDLCWGVATSDFDATVDGATFNDVEADNPYINVVKPTVTSKIDFRFRHALAALNIQIDADFDETDHSDSDATDAYSSEDFLANTRIYVRSVSFEGFTTKGALNLNSSWEDSDGSRTPQWADLGCTGILSEEPVSVYDGRRDGKEGRNAADVKTESPLGLNEQLIQRNPYTTTLAADGLSYSAFNADNKGVTHELTNLFALSDPTDADEIAAPIFVIPTGSDLVMNIVYDVETADPTLAGYLSDGVTHGVSVQNAISKSITANGTSLVLEAGKKYTIKMHLGMTSVKFTAEVENWDDQTEEEYWHPINS